MYLSNHINQIFWLAIVTLVLLLSNCSDRSQYGESSDYEKLGAPDTTAPTISSVSPTDNSTYNSPATTVAVTFSENMATGSVTTNTSDTTCSGSFQLSSDNFTTCIKMSGAPSASENVTTFTSTPTDNLSGGTTYKLRITTSATDDASNSLASAYTTTNGFTTSPSGSGTINGSVQMDNGSSLSGVSVIDVLHGSTVATMTSDNNGDFSQTSLALGMHTLTYSKSGYLDLTMKELLELDNETLVLETVRLLPDNCTSGTMSGTITNALTGDNMSGVSLSYTIGLNKWSGFSYFGDTDTSGAWSLSMSEGWYTIQSVKSGYYYGYHNAKACGNQTEQNNSLSPTLNEGEMRIVLKWPKTNPVTAKDLDAHLQIPDNASSTFHVYYPTSKKTFYYATNTNTCGSCSSDQLSDNVTVDKDHKQSTGAPPGDETMTISKVRSGTYSFSVHNYSDGDNDTLNYKTNFSKSRAKVKVFYCPWGQPVPYCNIEGSVVRKRFNIPNDNGTLWKVFTFDNSSGSGSGFTRVDNMTYEDTGSNIY
jgi:hypothetical protein